MSEKLTDPNKAAHEIVEVRADGDAVRNDVKPRTPAKENPFYVMATLFGNQEEGDQRIRDPDLEKQNRRAWNLWFCQNLDKAVLEKLARDAGLELADLQPKMIQRYAVAELDEIKGLFKSRMLEVGVEGAEPPNFPFKIDFENVDFEGHADFSNFVFPQICSFAGACFHGQVRFNSTSFGSLVYFDKVKFTDYAGFKSVKFNNQASFMFSEFNDIANFSGATFRNMTSFECVTFGKNGNFSSAKFESNTIFTDTRFLTHVPDFHGAELYEKTLFPTNANDDGNWPPRAVDERNPKGQMPVGEQGFAYNRLQQFMNKTMRIDDEQFFHRMEMRCKGKIDGGAYGVMHAVFDAVSEYGNSVWKPVSWLLVLIAAGAAAMLFHLEMGEPATGEKFWTSFGWSISNMLPFLGVGKLYYGAEFAACMPVWLKVLGGVQTLLGFILLFLLGLGLRNRFRLR